MERGQVFPPPIEWKSYPCQGQLGAETVNVIQIATYQLSKRSVERVCVKLENGDIYICMADDIVQNEGKRQSWLDNGYLIIDNSAFMLAELVEWIPI